MNTASTNRLADARARLESASRLLASGRAAEARSWIEQAIGLAPAWAEPHVMLARAELELSGVDKAEAVVRTALEADPQHAGAAHLLGVLLFRKDQLAAARTWFQAAVDLDPTVAIHLRDLGVVQLFLGQIAEGRATLEEALRLDPMLDEVVDTLAHTLPSGGDGTETDFLDGLLRDMAERTDLSSKTRAQVHFGLGKIQERRGQTDEAFASITAGNALMRSLVAWDAEETERRFRRVAEVFDQTLMTRLAGYGDPTQRPVFIVGMPRSGSTLVEQILSAHPMVNGGGEFDLLTRMVKEARGPGDSVFPEWSATMLEPDCANLAQLYLERAPSGLPGQTRVTDKRLENFEYLGLIHLLMPRATIIHCRRDPRDSAFSSLSLRFSMGQEYSYDMAELGRYWRGYDAIMDHWRRVLPQGLILDVQYEDLVADLEGGARRIVGHCGLDWDEACLRFHEAKRPVRSASLAQVREPIFTRSIGRWKPFAAHLAPLFTEMGLKDA